MKYFIAFPISYDCNLRCHYCFHEEKFRTNYAPKRQFTIPQYCLFRDTHLKNPEEIVVHFHGGEPFIDTNINSIVAFMRQTQMERADFLTNGLQERSNYEKILEFKTRIFRIGFTFHRKMIAHIPSLVRRYEENVLWAHAQGIPIYVKELLFADEREAIKEYRRYWRAKGIDVRIQDFKGCDRGRSKEEYKHYTPEDLLLIHSEYKHGGDTCSCMKNYRNVLIRGGWEDGDVLACFEDPVVIGRIQDNVFNPGYKIWKNREKACMDVLGVPKTYKGTWDRDMYVAKQCGSN